jgi:hypothetical protein
MFHHSVTGPPGSPEPPSSYPVATPDADRAKKPPLPEPPYKPYSTEAPVPAAPYEPYKGI